MTRKELLHFLMKLKLAEIEFAEIFEDHCIPMDDEMATMSQAYDLLSELIEHDDILEILEL